MKTIYKILNSRKDIVKLVNSIKEVGIACVDFETNGQGIYNKEFVPTILSVTFQPGSACIIPLLHQDSKLKGSWLKHLKYFGREVIENPDIVKMAWNWKFDNQIFRKYGIYSRGTVIDGMLAKYLLNEERPNGLKDMVNRYLPEYGGYEESPEFKKEKDWGKKPFEPLCEYAATDTDMTFRLCTFFENKLMANNLYNLYRNLLMPASIVLQSVETKGLKFDIDFNKELEHKYKKLIDDKCNFLSSLKPVKRFIKIRQKERIQEYIDNIEREIEDILNEGKPTAERLIKAREEKIVRIIANNFQTKAELALIEPINFNSTKQLIELLYTHDKGLRKPIINYTKCTKTKRPTNTPSTSEETLLQLVDKKDDNCFIKHLLELRGYEHSNSTFIKGYQELIQDDGYIHPIFNLHTTVTGRLSSNKPNAQQIPKKEVNPDIKKQFITPEGMLFLSYDYSQAELRIMAHLAKEDTLLKAFRDGKDLHLAIACKKYGYEYDDILPIYLDETHPEYITWKVRRKNAKLTVFGLIYGIESKKLATQLSDIKLGILVSPEQAQQEIDDFFKIYPKVKTFMTKQKRLMEKHGFVRTLFGRKRRCPNIYSDNYGLYLEAVRQSINSVTQSAASDMALFASILIFYDIKAGKLPPMLEVSTVHDSIYNYIRPEFLNPWLIYQLYQICKNPDTKKYFGFSISDVDMAMDFSVGRTMVEELPFTPGYDYTNLLNKDFDKDEYYVIHNKTKSISIDDYPKAFPEYFKDDFIKGFRDKWIRVFQSN